MHTSRVVTLFLHVIFGSQTVDSHGHQSLVPPGGQCTNDVGVESGMKTLYI